MDFWRNLFNSSKNDVYSTETNSFHFKKDNDFWHSIAFAHKEGRKGKGVKVAVVDVAFDMSYPALKAKTKLYRNYSTYETSERHGNIVALLVLEVAPDVELYLFDIGKGGSPNPDFLDLAIKEIQEIGIDVVNLSWGKKILKKVHSATELAIEHCNCYVCSSIKPLAEKMLVVTSVGNDSNYQYCPSTVPNVFNASFQYEKIEIKKGIDGGSYTLSDATKPLKYSQSLNTHFTIMQPEGLIGSSFASPLFVGVIALMENPKKELPYFLFSSNHNAQAASLFTSSQKNNTISQKLGEIEQLFLTGLRANPHGFYCKKQGFCFECSMFCLDGYENLSLLYLNTSNFPNSYEMAGHASKIASFSAHAYATLATTVRVVSENAVKNNSPKAPIISDLELAIEFYDKAIERKPENHEVYKGGQKICSDLLERLKS